MEFESNSSDKEEARAVGVQYLETLFSLHPDDELLARMWEMNPETMSRLMPAIGHESTENISYEMSCLRGVAYMALNSLRITIGREIRLTPRQRMREAKLRLDECVCNVEEML